MHNQTKEYFDEAERVMEDERIKRHNLHQLTMFILNMGISDELYEEYQKRFGKFDLEGV